MPMEKVLLKPGITTEATFTLADGGWSVSNLIRWRDGYLEKMFGWLQLTSATLTGVCRTLHDWMDLDSNKYLAAGTNQRLQVYSAGAIYDITPLRDFAASVAVVLDTVSSSKTVTITDAAHGATTGDTVHIVIPVSVGGIVLHGYYEVTVVDVNNYTVQAETAATSTVTNGGAVPTFTTVNGSPNVTVTLANHGYLAGETFNVEISTTVATVVLHGGYLITSILSANTFRIVGSTNANASTTGAENGGNEYYEYLINPGTTSTMVTTGYGSGGYGLGGYGSGSSSTTAVTYLRIWSLDNFSTDLLAQINNGPLYKWTPPIDNDIPSNRAVLVTGDPPDESISMFVAMPQLQAVCLGAEILGTQDPLLVRFSEIGDYTVWTATSTNQAGSFRLSRGSRIIGGLQGPLAAFIWTDVDLWQMQYVGLPFIYSFTILAKGCGLIGPLAACISNSTAYWMSLQGFYSYAGRLAPIPCAVYDNIFQDLDTTQTDKIIAAASSTQNEISWFYPSLSGGTGEVDKYVKYNTLTGEWDYGSLIRTAWVDHNVFGEGIGVDEDGILQQHGQTYNANNAAMTGVMAQTGMIDITNGEDLMFLDMIIPDFKLLGTNPQVSLTVIAQSEPNGDLIEYGPYPVTTATKFITPQIRARQMALRVNCDALDTWFRLGATRVRLAPAGRVA